MLRYELGVEDLGSVRFAVSPPNEAVRSLRAVFQPSRFPVLRNWSDYARQAIRRTNVPVLRALLNDRLWTPDYLTPRPGETAQKIDSVFRALRQLDPEFVRTQLVEHHGRMPAVLEEADDTVSVVIADALEEYWSVVVAPQWDWLQRTLDADIAYRARRIAQRGIAAALDEIAPALTFAAGTLAVRGPVDRVEPVDGAGLVLTPSMFSSRVAMPLRPGTPMLLYAARGQGAMWESFSAEDPSLVGLIGRRRAQLLDILSEPATSTQLAAHLRISVPAVNQHLRALQGAGLLISFRSGRSVVYRRTSVGESLVRRSGGEESALQNAE